MTINDPALDSKNPEPTQQVDPASADAELPPYDLHVVNGVGISERDPCDLSATRPYGNQSFSQADIDLIAGLAILIAAGDGAENTLNALTWMELETMGGAIASIERDPDQYTPRQLAGLPRLRALVLDEIEMRHSGQPPTSQP